MCDDRTTITITISFLTLYSIIRGITLSIRLALRGIYSEQFNKTKRLLPSVAAIVTVEGTNIFSTLSSIRTTCLNLFYFFILSRVSDWPQYHSILNEDVDEDSNILSLVQKLALKSSCRNTSKSTYLVTDFQFKGR